MATLCLNFHGNIGHPGTTKLRNLICGGINERVPTPQGAPVGPKKYDKLFLFLNSTGGSLDDGLSLYGLLKTIPLEVTTINTGMVASIAILPFMAGANRIAFPQSFFHFHSTQYTIGGSGSSQVMIRSQFTDLTQLMDAIRDRILDILKSDASLTDADLDEIKQLNEPVVKDAAFAKQKGIATEVKYVAIPQDAMVINIDY